MVWAIRAGRFSGNAGQGISTSLLRRVDLEVIEATGYWPRGAEGPFVRTGEKRRKYSAREIPPHNFDILAERFTVHPTAIPPAEWFVGEDENGPELLSRASGTVWRIRSLMREEVDLLLAPIVAVAETQA